MQPCKNFNSVGRLPLEVVSDVVHDDGPVKVSAKQRQILDIDSVFVLTMLPVKSVIDELVFLLNVVQNEVCIVLSCGCENYHFVYL